MPTPKEKQYSQDLINNDEPSAFSIDSNTCSIYGVASDSYSYLDQPAESLQAKGNGGLRQLYTYSTINQDIKIETPKDDYEPDKVGSVSIDNISQQRENDIRQVKPNKNINIEDFLKRKN